MKLLKHLYKVAYDDVKDAEMILGYAEDAAACENGEMAKYFANLALTRAKHYEEVITLFNNWIKEEKINLDHDSLGCVVCHMIEELDDWKEGIIRRVEKL